MLKFQLDYILLGFPKKSPLLESVRMADAGIGNQSFYVNLGKGDPRGVEQGR